MDKTTDRDAMNQALVAQLEAAGHEAVVYEPWTTCADCPCSECNQRDFRQPKICPHCGGEMVRTLRRFTESLDAAVLALNALGLFYTCTVGHDVVEILDLGAYESQYATDSTPAALATALVRAALAVLDQEV